MRTYLLPPLMAVTLFAFGCRKKNTATPAPTNTTSTIDAGKVAGTYIGTTKHRYSTNTGTATHADSSTSADTFVITKITADSFVLTKPVWDIAQPGFKYDGTNTYTRTRGTTSFNDHMDELTITFDPPAHTISVQKHHVAVSSWIMENWDDFTGKQ